MLISYVLDAGCTAWLDELSETHLAHKPISLADVTERAASAYVSNRWLCSKRPAYAAERPIYRCGCMLARSRGSSPSGACGV
jgi:hypothetical protein